MARFSRSWSERYIHRLTSTRATPTQRLVKHYQFPNDLVFVPLVEMFGPFTRQTINIDQQMLAYAIQNALTDTLSAALAAREKYELATVLAAGGARALAVVSNNNAGLAAGAGTLHMRTSKYLGIGRKTKTDR